MRDLLNPLIWLLSLMLSVRVSGSCETSITMPRERWYVGVGQNFTLHCSVVCLHPSSTLQWYHDNKLLNTTNNVPPSYTLLGNYTYPLIVIGAMETDAGTYHCQTTAKGASSLVKAYSHNVFIEVVDLHVTVSSELLEVYDGDNVSVNCTVNATSPVNVTHFWAHGGCDASGMLGSDDILSLPHASTFNSGEYHCCASVATRTPLHKSRRVRVNVTGDFRSLLHMSLYYMLGKAVVFLLFIIFFCFLRC